MNSCFSIERRRTALAAVLLAISATLISGCVHSPAPRANAEAEIRRVLDQQVREWNAGNLDGFMETYARSEQTRFASGGNLQRGWQSVYDRYKTRYPNRTAMGRTIFSELEIELLGPDAAMAFGHWRLEREQGDQPQGLFTLILKRQQGQWLIVHDHTSVADKK